jgi:hypothetical protein
VNAIVRDPQTSGAGLLIMGAGIPLYLWFRRGARH